MRTCGTCCPAIWCFGPSSRTAPRPGTIETLIDKVIPPEFVGVKQTERYRTVLSGNGGRDPRRAGWRWLQFWSPLPA